MPGKHRRTSRPAAICRHGRGARRPGGRSHGRHQRDAAAVPADTTVAAPSVDLLALVSAANSTSQFFAGSSYYGTDWTKVYGSSRLCRSWRGRRALRMPSTCAQTGTEQTGVTASGWGAGQTGTALGILAENSDPDDLNEHRSGHPRQQHQPRRRRFLDDLLSVRAAAVHLVGAHTEQHSGVSSVGCRLRVQHQLGCPGRPAQSVRPRQQLGRVRIRLRGGVHGRWISRRGHAGGTRSLTKPNGPDGLAAGQALRRRRTGTSSRRTATEQPPNPNTTPPST